MPADRVPRPAHPRTNRSPASGSNGRRRVRVLAADGHPLYRDAMARAIKERPELELVGQAGNGRAALRAIGADQPDVALIERKLPGLTGDQIVKAVARDGFDTRVVLIGAEPEPGAVYSAIANGAAGYLTKEADSREICDAIAAVARGGNVFGAGLQRGIAGEIRLRAVDERPFLSEREREVLKLIAEGMTAPQIGRSIHLGVATVKTHLQHIFADRKQGPVLQQLEHPLEADVSVNDCLRPVSRFFDRIARPEQLLTALPEAMRVLLDPADTGAVTICLHQDVQGDAYDWPASFFSERVWPVVRRPPVPDQIAAAVERLRTSERPLIIAGGGVRYSGARAELEGLAAGLGIPVCETSAAKGTVRSAELLLGGVGVNGTRAANAVAREADLVICVGTRLSDFTTASHSLFQHPEVRFLGVNVCEADAYKLGAAPLVADARLALVALHEAASGWSTSESYRAEVKQALEQWHAELDADLQTRPGERMSQGRLLRVLNGATQRGDWVVAAAGSPPGDLLKMFDCSGGVESHIEFAYSCMGHELPAALGIRMAAPAAGEIYAVIGDGTYLMAPSELATAVQEGLEVTVVLVVNHGYQSIHGLQTSSVGQSFGNEFRRRDGESLSGDFLPLDFAANAASFGCAVFEAGDEAGLADALAAARAERRPSVVVAEVEPRRGLLDAGAWWDLGVAETSTSEVTREIAADHARRGAAQRFYG